MIDKRITQHNDTHRDILDIRKGENILTALARYWKETGEEVWPRGFRLGY